MRNKVFVFSFLVLVVLIFIGVNPISRQMLLSLVYQEKITPENLQASYRARQFKILLVPGHDEQYGGAEFRGLREADLNLLIALELYQLLVADKHFAVTTTRDLNSGAYTETFSNFFLSQKERILAFYQEKKSIFDRFLNTGELKSNIIVSHNFAPAEVATRLHGINLWANENEIDLTLHIHANDFSGRKFDKVGGYYGFSIYVPEHQYPNSRASIALAQSLSAELQQSMKISNLPKESAGVIEDQELIAVGSFATRDGAAVLVEYGYIYEPRFVNLGDRQWAAKDLARRTYDGLVRFLE